MRPDAYDFTGFYTIVLIDCNEFDYKTVYRILSDCWKLYISNVHVLVSSSTYGTILLYTYYPYTIESCEVVKPVIQDIYMNNTFIKNSTIFPEKFQNFYKCPLTLSTYEFWPLMFLTPFRNGSYYTDGLDGITFRVISQQLNFTPIVKIGDKNVFKTITVNNSDGTEPEPQLKPSLDMVIIIIIFTFNYLKWLFTTNVFIFKGQRWRS